jgi:cell division protein FtsW (lipid II flippase)
MSRARSPSAWQQRKPERSLLFLVCLIVASGFCALLALRLANAPVWDVTLWLRAVPLGIYLLLVLFLHLSLVMTRFGGSTTLLPPVLLLAGLGILSQHRISGIDVSSLQFSVLAYPLGILTIWITAQLLRAGRYRVLQKAAPLCLLLALGVVAAVLVFGSRFRGAMFMRGNMTPTEVLKPLLAVYVSAVLTPLLATGKSRRGLSGSGLLGPLLAWGLLMILLVLQRDLGMIVLLNGMLLLMLYAATGSATLLGLGLVVGIAGGAAMLLLTSHGQQRLAVWLDPFASPTGRGWQVLQSLSALYSGGLFGTGLGEGAPHAIPVASSDFIYAVIGEELGFLGCTIVVLTYLGIVAAGYRIAENCKDPFGRLLAAGLVSVLAVQTLLNIAGATKALPLTGVPLPFLSQGGSSIMVSSACIGILLAISSDGAKAPARKRKRKPARRG